MLKLERRKIGAMEEGEVAITPGFQLPAKFIIHAVSPCYMDGMHGEERKLRECYQKSLQLAYKNNCKSIAFPLIATGSFGYPKEEGMRIAVDEINAFLLKHDMLIYLVVFGSKATGLGKNLYPNLETYIDQHYVQDKWEEEYGSNRFGTSQSRERKSKKDSVEQAFVEKTVKRSINTFGVINTPNRNIVELSKNDSIAKDYDKMVEESEAALKERISHMSDTFQQYLLYLIKSRGMKNSDVYRRALVTKQLFSKIKGNVNYHPDKGTAMRLCVGAMLNLDETKDLLARAGYALSPCDKRDIIFSYFIENEIFDMLEIEIALEVYDIPGIIK